MTRTFITLGVLSLLALTGCVTHVTSSVPPKVLQPAAFQANVEALQRKLSKTKAATEAGDFVVAKREFGHFGALWQRVKDDLKTKSSHDYMATTKSIDEVNSALNSTPLSRERAILLLKALEKSLTADRSLIRDI